MKKSLLSLLIIFILFGSFGCNNSKTVIDTKQDNNYDVSKNVEGKYPITWKGENLYKDYDEWLLDYEKIKDYPKVFEKFRGKLNTVDGLYEYTMACFNPDFLSIYEKLQAYSDYGVSAFPSNPTYLNCYAKLNAYAQEYDNATAFVNEELFSIPYKDRVKLFNDEKLKKYKHYYSIYLDEDAFYLDEKEQLIANTLGFSDARAEGLYSILAYSDLNDVEFILPSGETIYINDTNLRSFLSKDYDLDTKLKIYDAWWENVSNYADAFAFNLESEMLEEYSYAKLKGFDSTKEYVLDDSDLPSDVIDLVLEAAHSDVDRHAQYFKVYANRDMSDKYYTFSEYKPISNYDYHCPNYDDAVDQVANSLNILGEEYINAYNAIINAGGIDVYPSDNKVGGAFECGGYYGVIPFVMFNYDDTFDSVSTIAHEMGHACFDKLTMDNREYQDWNPSIFTQEVASTTNELLFTSYLINNAKTDEEKLFYLENILSTWTGSFFRQCFFQEFENYCHEKVESGETLVADDLTQKWEELSRLYYGNDISLGEYGAYRWITLDHLYYNHYVFKYATSICYASIIASDILNNKELAVDNYLAFLKDGNSKTPAEALKMVGIDIEDKNTYVKALNYFDTLLDEFVELSNKVNG